MISPESKAQYIQQVTNAKLTVSGTTSLETIYTAPTGTDFDFAILESILVCDYGNQQTNIDISISTGASNFYIFKQHNITANQTDELLENDLVLTAGQVLKIQASHANINVIASLVEYAKGD